MDCVIKGYSFNTECASAKVNGTRSRKEATCADGPTCPSVTWFLTSTAEPTDPIGTGQSAIPLIETHEGMFIYTLPYWVVCSIVLP